MAACGGSGGVLKGPWTEEEDEKLLSYIRQYGHGHWETLARNAGLNRKGKSCRLRWLNYLRPGVRRGNISPQEQLTILQLHSRWGNRWSKIAECLPGRSDNEVKNYWRTRVQKQAKQLKCDVNSDRFREILDHVWMPQLAERVGQTQSDQSLPIIMKSSEKLSSSDQPRISNEQASSSTVPISQQLSDHQQPSSLLGYNNLNEDDIELEVLMNLDTTLLDQDLISCEKAGMPWEDFPWRNQGVLEEGTGKEDQDFTNATWVDHDHIYTLENMWNDDEMGQGLTSI